MASKLKLYIDYPYEIWIDSNFIMTGETSKPNIITLNRGTYNFEFKENGITFSSKIIKINDDNYEYLENLKLIQNDPRFHLEYVYYTLGSFSLANGAELGLWSENGYAITKPIYYNIEHLGYGMMRDMYDVPFGVDDLYKVRNFSNEIGIISPTGEELLKCEYSEINREYSSLQNTRLFIEMLIYIKYKRIGELLTKYIRWHPNSLHLLTDVQAAINLLPVFWFTVAKKSTRYGVIGLNNEIFVPFEFEYCEFLGPSDIFSNLYEQTYRDNEQMTRQDAHPLHFKVKLYDKWGIYLWNPNGNSGLITDIKYDDCEYIPTGPVVILGEKAALLDDNGNFASDFIDKSKLWIFCI